MFSLRSKFLAITIFLLFSITQKTTANHVGSLELTYRNVSGNTYEFTLTLYRNCAGTSTTIPGQQHLQLKSASRSINIPLATVLNLLPTVGPNTPPLSLPNVTNCYTAATTCWEEYVYRGMLNMDTLLTNPNADDWIFFVDECCWMNGVLRPQNVVFLNNSYAECGLNNLDFSSNTSAIWHNRRPNIPGHTTDTLINYPIRSACTSFETNIDLGTKEYDGDIVKYHFVNPLTSGGAAVGYSTGGAPPYFNLAYPMYFLIPPGLNLDSLSGKLSLIPGPYAGQYLLALKAIEYRPDTTIVGGVPVIEDKQVGYVYRNFMFYVDDQSTCPDKGIKPDSNDIHLSCRDTSIIIEFNKKFLCNSIDLDASMLLLREKISGDTIQLDSAKPYQGYYNLVAEKIIVFPDTSLKEGQYELFLIKGNDSNTVIAECGAEIQPFLDTVNIVVDSVDASKLLGSLDSNNFRLNHIISDCGKIGIGVKLSDPILCSSLDSLGSEFVLLDSTVVPTAVIPLNKVKAINCSNGLADSLYFSLSKKLGVGTYSLYIKNGNDGNTLKNECGELTVSTAIDVLTPEISIDLGEDKTYCKDSVFYAILGPKSGFAEYSWSTGDTIPQIVVTYKGTYILEVDNGYGCKDKDTLVVTEIDCGTGINENSSSHFTIYPNPTGGEITIKSEKLFGSVTVQIIDDLGKEVLLKEFTIDNAKNSIVIDLSTINNGNYFMRLKDQNGVQEVQKIVVLK